MWGFASLLKQTVFFIGTCILIKNCILPPQKICLQGGIIFLYKSIY